MRSKRKTYSRARRKAIGEGVSRRYQESWEKHPELPEKKRCPKCTEILAASAFGITRRKLKSGIVVERLSSWCRECSAEAQRERIARLQAEGVDVKAKKREQDRRWRANLPPKKLAALREREREWQAITRRKKGDRVLGWRKGMQPLTEGERLEPGPIIELLVKEFDLKGEPNNPYENKGLGLLAERSDVPPRRIYGLLHEEYDRVALATVDKLLIGMGLPHMLPILYPEA